MKEKNKEEKLNVLQDKFEKFEKFFHDLFVEEIFLVDINLIYQYRFCRINVRDQVKELNR